MSHIVPLSSYTADTTVCLCLSLGAGLVVPGATPGSVISGVPEGDSGKPG